MEQSQAFEIGDASLSIDEHGFVHVGGRSIRLTARESQLLAFFVQNRGQVVSRKELLGGVWGSAYAGGPRTVDVHVRRLRVKLGDLLRLDTERGAGYRLR